MKDEEGHLKERRIDYSKELQMFVKRGATKCQNCPLNILAECDNIAQRLFHVDCTEIDLSTLEVHGL